MNVRIDPLNQLRGLKTIKSANDDNIISVNFVNDCGIEILFCFKSSSMGKKIMEQFSKLFVLPVNGSNVNFDTSKFKQPNVLKGNMSGTSLTISVSRSPRVERGNGSLSLQRITSRALMSRLKVAACRV